MEQEQRYARLLEIPVDSCTVITKKSKKRTLSNEERLKNKAIAEVNRQAEVTLAPPSQAVEEASDQAQLAKQEDFAPAYESEQVEMQTHAPEIPLRFAPVIESAEGATEEEEFISEDTAVEDEALDSTLPVCEIMEELPKEEVRKEAIPPVPKKKSFAFGLTAVVCAVLSVAFLLNAFVFRFDFSNLLSGVEASEKTADNRLRGAFSLTLPTAGAYVIENGVMQFSDKGGVYATEDGTITSLTADGSGAYTMEISHSDLFKTVITGVSTPFNKVGDTVYRAQPVAYGLGETVSVSFYENGEKLICAVEEGTLKV